MAENERKHVTIIIEPSLHVAMKRLADDRRMHVGAVYEAAIEDYVSRMQPPRVTIPIKKAVAGTDSMNRSPVVTLIKNKKGTETNGRKENPKP